MLPVLNDLRRYIIDDSNVLSEDGKMLKIMCERCHDRNLVIEFLEQIDINSINNEVLGIFDNLADNWHIADYTNGDSSIILKIMLKCFGDDINVDTSNDSTIELLKSLYSLEEPGDVDISLIRFLEECEIGDDNDLLNLMTEPYVSKYDFDKRYSRILDYYNDHDTFVIRVKIGESCKYLDEFYTLMDLLGMVKVNDHEWYNACSGYIGYDYDEFMRCFDLSLVDLKLVSSLIESFEKLSDLDCFDYIFRNLGDSNIYNDLIEEIMNAKRTKEEILL